METCVEIACSAGAYAASSATRRAKKNVGRWHPPLSDESSRKRDTQSNFQKVVWSVTTEHMSAAFTAKDSWTTATTTLGCLHHTRTASSECLATALSYLFRRPTPVVVDGDRLELAQSHHAALLRRLRSLSLLLLLLLLPLLTIPASFALFAKKLRRLLRVRLLVQGEPQQRESQAEQDAGREGYSSAGILLRRHHPAGWREGSGRCDELYRVQQQPFLEGWMPLLDGSRSRCTIKAFGVRGRQVSFVKISPARSAAPSAVLTCCPRGCPRSKSAGQLSEGQDSSKPLDHKEPRLGGDRNHGIRC